MKRFTARTLFVSMALAALILGVALSLGPAPGALTAAALIGLIGGSAGCSFAYGAAAGLGISSRVATLVPGAQVVGAVLGISAIVVGFGAHLYC